MFASPIDRPNVDAAGHDHGIDPESGEQDHPDPKEKIDGKMVLFFLLGNRALPKTKNRHFVFFTGKIRTLTTGYFRFFLLRKSRSGFLIPGTVFDSPPPCIFPVFGSSTREISSVKLKRPFPAF